MNRSTKRRLRRVENVLDSLPTPVAVIREAMTNFRETGELPEDENLCYLLYERIQTDNFEFSELPMEMELAAALRRAIEAKPRAEDPLMDELYCEAIWGKGVVRFAAREVLRRFASLGLDPSQPLLAGRDVTVPDWGGVGVHLLGIPDKLVQPPYEEQARRLFARCEVLPGAVPQGDDAWQAAFSAAVDALHNCGELPEPGILRDAVLVDVEMGALMAHAAGRDASEVMAAMDAVHQASGIAHEEALAHLVALAREGKLRPKAPPGEDQADGGAGVIQTTSSDTGE